MRVNVSLLSPKYSFYFYDLTLISSQDPEIQNVTGKTDPVDVMAALREMKNAM
jgi:hypothetical protein